MDGAAIFAKTEAPQRAALLHAALLHVARDARARRRRRRTPQRGGGNPRHLHRHLRLHRLLLLHWLLLVAPVLCSGLRIAQTVMARGRAERPLGGRGP